MGRYVRKEKKMDLASDSNPGPVSSEKIWREWGRMCETGVVVDKVKHFWHGHKDTYSLWFQDGFACACGGGDECAEIRAWLMTLGAVPTIAAFHQACVRGQVQNAQWLLAITDAKHEIHDYVTQYQAFRDACYYGQLESAKWLVSLGNVNIHSRDDDAFMAACVRGHLEIAQWLVSLGGVKVHVNNDIVFRSVCSANQLAVGKWLVSLGGVDIHAKNDEAFATACYKGYFEVAQWLVSLGGVDIHAKNDEAFVSACTLGYLKL